MTIMYEPAGDEFQVALTPASQYDPAIAALAGGGFIIVWASHLQDGSGWGVFAQLYSADGTPIGAEFQINSYTASDQWQAGVAPLEDGGFVITWASEGQDGHGYGIYAQLYAADGTPIGGEFQVNSYTSSDQNEPAIAALTNGGFIITWKSDGQDGELGGIYAQLYGADGTPIGGEFQVNTYTTSLQFAPTVAALADGGFVISWSSWGSFGPDTTHPGVLAQRYAADGTPIGGEFQVNAFTWLHQESSAIAALADGGFVITWMSSGQDGDNWGIYAQRYGADGALVGGEFQVNTYTVGEQTFPTIAALPDGGFMISWTSFQDGSAHGIYAQRYAADGTPIGDEFQVNAYTLSHQMIPVMAVLDNGDLVISWASYQQDGSNWGIFAQRYSPFSEPIYGGNGDDPITGSWAADQLFGGNGDDPVFGGAGNDFLYGGNGNDMLDGGAGDDILDGGRGDDTLTGGSGDDSFIVNKNTGNDTITDFEVGSDDLILNDDITVESIEQSGDDTLVHLSNGSTVTLLGVSLDSIDALSPSASLTTFTTPTSDGLLV